MYIRMIYHMPKAIGWHGDSRKIVKIFAILKKIPFWTETSKFMRSRISKKNKVRNFRISFWNLKFCWGQNFLKKNHPEVKIHDI